MITSFEVASIFRIKDEATFTLNYMSEKVTEFNLMVKEARENLAAMSGVRLSGLSARLGGLTDQAVKLKQSFGTTFAAMDTGITSAVAEVRLLADEWRAVASAAVAAGRATRGIGIGSAAVASAVNPRARVVGAHGGGDGVHVSSLGVPLPGGHASIRGGGNVAMIGAGALAYGIYEESKFEDAAFRAMYTAGIPVDKEERTRRMTELRNLVQKETTRTGAPIGDIEEALLTGLRQFAGLPWKDRLKIMPDLIEGAAAEAVLKGHGTTVTEGMEVFTGLAHMTKEYSPEQIKKLIPGFAYLSTVDPEKIKQIEKAASYAVPVLQSGLGIDPMDTMLLVAALQRGGVTNTKSGTWIREMAIRAMPGTSVLSRTAFKKHEEALRAFGLVDASGKPTWFTDGKPDVIKMLDIAGAHAQSIPLTERAAYERQLFGARGSGAMAILSDPAVIKQVHVLREEMAAFKTGETFFEEYEKASPVQQFRDAWADLQRVLMDIGKSALPPVTQGLGIIDDFLKKLAPFLPKGDSKTAGGAVVGSMVGGALGWRFGQPLAGAAAGAVVGADIASSHSFRGGFLGAVEDTFRLGWDFLSDHANHPISKIELPKIEKQSYLLDMPGRNESRSISLNVVPPPSPDKTAPGRVSVMARPIVNVPSPSSQQAVQKTIQVSTTINLDGRKIAEAVTKHQVEEAAGPAEGAPYHDSTYSTMPPDFALAL